MVTDYAGAQEELTGEEGSFIDASGYVGCCVSVAHGDLFFSFWDFGEGFGRGNLRWAVNGG
jgi:hypothetical protein